MKDEIHPKVREVVFQDIVSGAAFLVLSPVKTDAKVEIVGMSTPAGRKAGVIVKDVDELLAKLHNEARVI